MGLETVGPSELVQRRGMALRGTLWRWTGVRSLLSPELCMVAAILTVIVIGLSLSGASGAEEESRNSNALGAHRSPVEGVAFAPDGRTVASVSRDGTVMIWDVISRQARRVTEQTPAGYSSIAFSPDGATLAAGGLDKGVTFIDRVSGRTWIKTSEEQGAIRDVEFSPQGDMVAWGGDDGIIEVWDSALTQRKLLLRGLGGHISSLTFAPDGQSLASARIDGRVMISEIATGRTLKSFKVERDAVFCLTFTSDGRSLALGVGGRIEVRELATGHCLTWATAQAQVTSVEFLPDGRGLASTGLDGSIALWDISSSEVVPRGLLGSHKGGVKTMAISPNGTWLITGGNDDAVKLWDLADPNFQERKS